MLGGFALNKSSTHARGLRLKKKFDPCSGLRLKKNLTHARGLRLNNFFYQHAGALLYMHSTRTLNTTYQRTNFDTSYIFTKYVPHGNTATNKSGLRYLGMLECSLPIALIDNLHRNTFGGSMASSIMGSHISTTTRRRRQLLHQLHINLRIVDSHKGQGNKSTTSKVLTNKAVDGLSVLESF
jgi:hypothetical protein